AKEPHKRETYARPSAATGYLALSRRYATAPYELWHLTLEDTIDTLGRSLMGLSLRCARCHDHKFDPVTTQDYYALYGIFSSTQFPWAGAEELHSKKFDRQHFVPLVPPEEAAPRLAAQRGEIAALEEDIKRRSVEDEDAKRVAELDAQVKLLEAARAAGETSPPAADSAEEHLAALKKERDDA